MTTDADKIDNLLAQRRELMDKIEEQIDERGRIIERIQSAPDTPIDRLREAHRPCSVPCFTHSLLGDRAHCWQWGEPWPCDTIAALDALTVRLQEQVETNMELAGLAGQQQLDAIALQARLDAATEQAEALAAAASIAYEYLGSITVTPNDWRFGMWEELGAALRAYREATP